MRNVELRWTYVADPWLVALLIALLAVVVVAVHRRAFRNGPPRRAAVFATLRFLSAAMVLVLLLRPILRFDVVHQREERFAVVVDRSQSMGVRDSVGGESRLDSALRVARGEALERIRAAFRTETYTFSGPGTLEAFSLDREDPASPGGGVEADGYFTDFSAALGALETGGEVLAGVVLLSDGRDHGPLHRDLRSGTGGVPGLPDAPVYTVGVGSGTPRPSDAAVDEISMERKVLQGSRVPFRATVRSRGLEGRTAVLRVSVAGDELYRREFEVSSGVQEVEGAFVATPAGRVVAEVGVEPLAGEASVENNRGFRVLEVTDRPLEVLFLEGRARWQYKFARVALSRDPDINVTGLVRLSGDRLLEQGRAPVDLRGGLPSDRGALRAFHVLVMGNVGTPELPPRLADDVRAWVASDGGGLVHCGGAESYEALQATPLGEILAARAEDGGRLEGPLAVAPELAALGHPVTQGLLDLFVAHGTAEPLVLAEACRGGRAAPGTEVLLSVSPAAGEERSGAARRAPPGGGSDRQLLLAARQYGSGRVVSYLTESDWKWVMQDAGGRGERVFHLLWGRMVRWAARRSDTAGVEGAVALSRDVARVGQEVAVTVFAAGERSGLRVRARDPQGRERLVGGGPEGRDWVGRLTPQVAGVHAIGVVGPEGGDREALLVARPDLRELEDTAPDWDHLRRLADATGGRFFTLADAGALADTVHGDHPSVVANVELGTERSWVLLGILVSLLAVEWLLRRTVFVV